MGQILSIPFVVLGIWILVSGKFNRRDNGEGAEVC
jgi:prolipoprotein diacylglyceryltransferase